MPISRTNTSLAIFVIFLTWFSLIHILNVFTTGAASLKEDQSLPQIAAAAFVNGNFSAYWSLGKSIPPGNYSTKKSQNQRLVLLRKKCVQYFPNVRRTYSADLKLSRSVIANHELHYLSCLVPKVASTSFKRLLSLANGAKKDPGFAVHHPLIYRPYFSPFESFPADERIELLKKHFKFTFVRHPFERLVSAYIDRFPEVGLTRYQNVHLQMADDIRRRYRSDNSTSNVTFAELVHYIIDEHSRGMQLDPHWTPFSIICQPCSVPYDFIGHYETLQQDTRYVLRKLNIDKLVQLPPDTRPYHKSADRVQKYFSQLPPDYVRQLRMIYHFDFELFGYT